MYQIYQNEIISPSSNRTVNNKIGLMYISDYGYAASPTYWTYKGNDTASTDYRATLNTNWMHMGIDEWTITSYNYGVFFIKELGNVYGMYVTDDNRSYYAVRPCFYLNSDVLKIDGLGTSVAPYRIV